MPKIKLILFFLSLCFILLLSGVGKPQGSDLNRECLSCHSAESECEERLKIKEDNFSSSVHNFLKCTDCHRILPGEKESKIPHKKDLPDVNCTAQCHRETTKDEAGTGPLLYPDSVHGKAYLERGVQEVAKCWDCHTKHNIKRASDTKSTVNRKNIPLTCSRCHDDEVLAKQYGFLTARLKTYSGSFHGTASKFGETRVANCASCHDFHDIRPSTDPKSSIHPDNLPQTCGNCHPGAGENFARGKIHVVSEKVSNKWAYFVKMFYIIMITAIVSVFLVFIAADLFHRLRQKRAKS